jgi:hypothetical protein
MGIVPTKKQLDNLKRGGIKGTPETAARAREAKAEQRAAEEARRFFEEIDGRLAAAAERMSEPKPAVSSPQADYTR